MAGDSSFSWLRPATEIETLFDCANRKGYIVTVYGLSLGSASPVKDDMVKKALTHLLRKVPSLRTCFRKRDDTLWACEMKHEQLDFQVTETKDLATAAEDLFHYKFPTTEGPLWCARLLPSDAPLPCPEPEASPDFPYIRTVLLANHHGINDGTSNMLVTQTFLHILDDVIAGTPIDDGAQAGKLVAGDTSAILAAMVGELRKDKFRLQNLKEEMRKFVTAEKLVPRAFPMPLDPNHKVQMVLRNLDKETTQDFIKRSKQEGVTVNSAMTAIINVSLVDLVQEAGLEQDTYIIHEYHSVNMRRYWSGDTRGTLGCHMLMPHTKFPTPAKWRQSFWDYTRTVHAEIAHGVKEKNAFLYCLKVAEGGSLDSFFEERPYPESDYIVGNIGNLDRLITTKRQHVRLVQLMRSTSCWNDPSDILFHTVNGCLSFSLVYCTDYLTRETSKRLVDILFDNLRTVTQQ